MARKHEQKIEQINTKKKKINTKKNLIFLKTKI